MTLVIDASVACKWFITETHSDHAEKLLAGDEALIAPDLIVPEVCNVAWLKLRRSEITADQAAAMVEGLPNVLDEVLPSTPLATRALAIASAIQHPAYDCFYLALAELRDTRVVTADRKLHSRLAGTPWIRRLICLGDAA